MRRSLILPAFIAILSMESFLSFALVTTQNEVTFEKRGFGRKGKGKQNDIKASSSTYRSNSLAAPHLYQFGTDSVTRQSVPKDQRQGFFSKIFNGKKFHADHIYEAQMYHDTLHRQGTSHAQLPPALQEDAVRIMNGPGNMAAIPAEHNIRKGQWVKQGLKKKAPSRGNTLTRSYSLSSYPAARQTAEQLQHAFQQHGLGHSGPTFHDTLHNTMTHAGVLTPGQPSPRNSPPRHSQSISHHDSGPVIPDMHRSQSTRPSRQRTPSMSSQMHRSQSTRPSSRQRAPSMSYQQPQAAMYQHPHSSSMTVHQQYAHATGQYVQQHPVYQNQYAHTSTPYVSHPHYQSSHARSPYHPY